MWQLCTCRCQYIKMFVKPALSNGKSKCYVVEKDNTGIPTIANRFKSHNKL